MKKTLGALLIGACAAIGVSVTDLPDAAAEVLEDSSSAIGGMPIHRYWIETKVQKVNILGYDIEWVDYYIVEWCKRPGPHKGTWTYYSKYKEYGSGLLNSTGAYILPTGTSAGTITIFPSSGAWVGTALGGAGGNIVPTENPAQVPDC